jgi:diguanylate cyclase (GGDEF)-like protein/PAS domain S-box-containing protein
MASEELTRTGIEEEMLVLRQRVEELERLATEDHEVRRELRTSEQRYRNIFNHSSSGYSLHEVVTDSGGDPVDYRFVELNQSYRELMNVNGTVLEGKLTSEISIGLDLSLLERVFGHVSKTDQPVRFEHYSEELGKYLDISAFAPRSGQIAAIYSDITAKKHAEESLRLRTVYFKHLFESSPLGIVLLDNDDQVVEVNESFEHMFGYTREEVRGKQINSLIVEESQVAEATVLSKQVFDGDLVDAESIRYRKDGSPVDVRILAHPIHMDGRQVGIYGIYSDISRRKRDELTGLVNRSTFMEHFEIELARADGYGISTAVLILDLDHLKDLNDTYGLSVGDAVLQAVAARFQATLREGASIARMGEDEFGVLQVEVRDVGNAAGLARRLLNALEEPFEIESHSIHVRASIGIAVAPAGCQEGAKQIVSRAERALAQAKKEGHSSFVFHTERMNQEVQQRMLLGQQLHGAIDRDELYLVYQPQIALPSKRIVGVEALLRWRHPTGREVGPGIFVPVAEASGVIVPIGDWVIRSACEQAVLWQNDFAPGIPVAVNLSAVQFKNPGFADNVVNALEESGLAPELLELELTERILVEATRTVRDALRRLRGLGVRFTLDDFGKGYSSFEYLRQLPLQKLKIDRSFVMNLESNSSDAAIVSAITVLGTSLGLKVLAEGVERQSQLDLLVDEGCNEIQGFFFSSPVAPEDVSRMMTMGEGLIKPLSRTEH